MTAPGPFDLSLITLEDAGCTARVEFRRGTVDRFADARSDRKIRALSESTEVVAVLTIRHWPPDSQVEGVREVRLEMTQGTITPSALRRFAWDRWITAADAYVRTGGADVLEVGEALQATATAQRRPGRRGHEPAFFSGIAARYLALRKDGVRNPVSRIAGEHCVNRNTAAGWVKQARRLGHLPPARPGRAG